MLLGVGTALKILLLPRHLIAGSLERDEVQTPSPLLSDTIAIML
jgi:hypothetical protein